jgi:hypothetical protein
MLVSWERQEEAGIQYCVDNGGGLQEVKGNLAQQCSLFCTSVALEVRGCETAKDG